MKLPEIHSVHHGFEITEIKALPEYKGHGIRARHQKLGLDVYQVFTDDDENLFAFGFKTLPETANGVAHIVEHTVLCGSKNYPIKDPFMLMVKGSMQTFLNAFTFPDKTVYPAASTVKKDLFNIFEVYADAVWNPLLDEKSFKQEGHRLEIDEKGQVIITGIVYNEMKGNYSSHASLAQEACLRSLFPNTAYGVDSGGDPRVIPELSYEAFKEFHSINYHPSNTLLFLYGNIPITDYFEILEQKFLQNFSALSPKIEKIALDPLPFTKPLVETHYYPSSEEEKDSSITINYLLQGVEDPVYVLGWEILVELLLGSAASPLQRALLESGLGEDLSPVTGLETEIRRLVLAFGLRGITADKKDKLQKLVTKTLETLVKKGFEPELVEGILRRFEFRSREIKGGPFGLRLMRKAYRAWLHGFDPERLMVFSAPFLELKKRINDDPLYFQKIIEKELLSNQHKTIISVLPDPEMQAREDAELRLELDNLAKTMKDSDFERLKFEQKELALFQSKSPSPEDIAKLPQLQKEDIPTKIKKFTYDKIDGQIPGIKLPIFSNGVSYLDIYINLKDLNNLELLFAPLLFGLIGHIGDEKRSFTEISTQLQLHTGGLSASLDAVTNIDGKLETFGIIRTKFLTDKTQDALNLIFDYLNTISFKDLKRVQELWLEGRNESRASIIHSGSSYASLKTERYFSKSEALEEWWRGISGMVLFEELENLGPKKLASFISQIATFLKSTLFQGPNLSYSLASDKDDIEKLHEAINKKALGSVKSKLGIEEIITKHFGQKVLVKLQTITAKLFEPVSDSAIETYLLSSKVAFNALTTRGPGIKDEEYASINMLCHILRTDALWEKIRMKGGAYGASASLDGLSKIISFSSYRDPRIKGTLDDFENAVYEMADQGTTDWSLFLSLIGMVSRELKPLSPSEQIYVIFRRNLVGLSDEIRQAIRDKTMQLKTKDIQEAALELKKYFQFAKRAVIASEILVDKELEHSPDFKISKTDINAGKGVFGL